MVDAAAYVIPEFAPPAWDATVVQVPAETKVITKPLTVHTPVVELAKETASPELDVGVTVTEPELIFWVDA